MTSPVVRVISSAGGAFAITPVPDAVRPDAGVLTVDVEFLSPDRQVRYLGRTMITSFLDTLADFFMRCAAESCPEQSVPTVEDGQCELAVSAIESEDLTVTIQFAIVVDPAEEMADYDGMVLDIRRAALVTAAHSTRELHEAVR